MKTRLLAVIAIHTNLEPPLEMIHLDEFAGDCVCRPLRGKLTFDDLIPVRFVTGLSVLRVDSLLACLHRSIGVGAEHGFVFGVEKCRQAPEGEERREDQAHLFLLLGS